MRQLFFKFIFLISMVWCCHHNSSTKENERLSSLATKKTQKVINAKVIETIDFIDFALSNDAEMVVSDWNKYKELSIQIDYLKQGDLSFFKDDKKTLQEFFKTLKKGLPTVLKTKPIESRIKVIETAVLKLNDDLTLDNIPYEEKLLSLKQVLVSFSSLNLSIDKKLERDFYDKITP